MSDSYQSPAQLPTMRHIIGVLLLTVAALGLSACSAVQLGYQRAPELGYWWLDSYLDFNDAQSLKVREDLAALQAWHRQSELPIYIRMLDKLQKMAPLDTTPEQVCSLYAELKTRLLVTLDQFEPTVSAMAPALTPGQIDQLARQLDKRNQKWREEWVDLTQAERHARRIKQMKDRSESFFGRLEEPQLAVLRSGLLATPLDMNLSYLESRRRQQDIVQTLRQLQSAKPGGAGVSAAMRGLLERSMDSPDPAYRNYMEKVTQAHCRTFAALHNSSTPAQRQHLLETLRDYQADARALTTPDR